MAKPVAMMDKEMIRAAKMRRQQRHDEKVRQVKEILSNAGYNLGSGLYGRKMEIEFFLGRGSVVVIAVCNDKAIKHVDIWIPLHCCDRTDDTLDALRKAVAA